MPRLSDVPKHKGFKGVVIAYSDDLSSAEKQHIRNWVEHAGGRHENKHCDQVTHFIVSRKSWNNICGKQEHIIKEIRKRKCCYLMTFAWLKDSLLHNKGKPILESTKNYSVEPKHAERVLRKIQEDKKARQQQHRQENTRRKRLIAAGYNPDDLESETTGEELSSSGVKHKKRKLQDDARQPEDRIATCGIKFNKSLIEYERDMATFGYRPYVDSSGVLYLITLLRNDVQAGIEDQYLLKLYESFESPTQVPYETPLTPSTVASFTPTPATTVDLTSILPVLNGDIITSSRGRTPHRAKGYALYVDYKKKSRDARQRANETLELAPPGSTWNFAYDIFRKFFRKKTGREWGYSVQETSTDLKLTIQSRSSSERPPSKNTGVTNGVIKEDEQAAPVTGLVEHQKFEYKPRATAQIEWISREYQRKYGEAWLPSHYGSRVAEEVEGGKGDGELVVQSRPDDEQMELVYDAGSVGEDGGVEEQSCE